MEGGLGAELVVGGCGVCVVGPSPSERPQCMEAEVYTCSKMESFQVIYFRVFPNIMILII